ncbi:MAG TPA: hypothetical protein VLU24_08825 [Mycobacterium sp.]|nr:hypothetical protein [Mycobacterium sp.]
MTDVTSRAGVIDLGMIGGAVATRLAQTGSPLAATSNLVARRQGGIARRDWAR